MTKKEGKKVFGFPKPVFENYKSGEVRYVSFSPRVVFRNKKKY